MRDAVRAFNVIRRTWRGVVQVLRSYLSEVLFVSVVYRIVSYAPQPLQLHNRSLLISNLVFAGRSHYWARRSPHTSTTTWGRRTWSRQDWSRMHHACIVGCMRTVATCYTCLPKRSSDRDLIFEASVPPPVETSRHPPRSRKPNDCSQCRLAAVSLKTWDVSLSYSV